MPEYSSSAPERARRIASAVRQAANAVESQKALAMALGISEATVNRLLNEHLENFAGVLAQLGQKVVSADAMVVDRATYDFLTKTHARVMARAPELVWDASE